LTAPTERPGEPITAGLPFGPGPGPGVQYADVNANDALWELRALVAQHPNFRDLARIVAYAESEL
jgi:hypothetical protein